MASRYPNIVPLGAITIATPGTTISLAINCGPLAGQVAGTYQNPPHAGTALRQIQLTADSNNTGLVYLLPSGHTASANPGAIIAAFLPGQTQSLPNGVMFSNGILPENFVLDTNFAGTQIIYGSGFTG